MDGRQARRGGLAKRLMEVTAKEADLLEMMRRMEYGNLRVIVVNSEPDRIEQPLLSRKLGESSSPETDLGGA